MATFVLLFIACAEAQEPPNYPALRATWTDAAWTETAWNAVRASSLVDITPNDISSYCSNYPDMTTTERGRFWVSLISALAVHESNLDPTKQFVESQKDSSGQRVISRGLLQLSIESVNQARYGCGVADASQLHDPIINLKCGVRILSVLVSESGSISRKPWFGTWRGAAAYWSPFRKAESRKKIQQFTQQYSACRA